MATVRFTKNLERHVSCPPGEHDGATLREVLDAYFAAHPTVRGYVVDERGVLRKHMNVFVDGEQIADRRQLSDAVAPGSQVYVMQALSGG